MSNSNPSLASGKIETHWLRVHNPQLVLFGELYSTQLGLASPHLQHSEECHNQKQKQQQNKQTKSYWHGSETRETVRATIPVILCFFRRKLETSAYFAKFSAHASKSENLGNASVLVVKGTGSLLRACSLVKLLLSNLLLILSVNNPTHMYLSDLREYFKVELYFRVSNLK